MKKIISLVIFSAALVWTWNLVHSSNAIGFETHSGIQQQLADLIKNTIQSKKPEATEVKIIKLWTESAGERKVKAVFSYSYSEPASATNPGKSERTIQGEALLLRDLSDSPSVDKWTLQSIKTLGDNVSYSDGSIITPDNAADDENEPATTN
jgi:hypothetical protein